MLMLTLLKAVRALALWAIALSALAWLCQRLHSHHYDLSYQVSRSMPQGWYYLHPITTLHRGTWVSLYPPPFAAAYLQQKHLAPTSGILIKAIAAVPGDWVCQKHQRLWVNHQAVASLLTVDSQHQAIAQQAFCQILSQDEYLVLGLSDSRSYDSRYFGPIHRRQILAEASPFFQE